MSRGALIILEGLDRAGKSTQVKLLYDALRDKSISVKTRRFPGMILIDYLILSCIDVYCKSMLFY